MKTVCECIEIEKETETERHVLEAFGKHCDFMLRLQMCVEIANVNYRLRTESECYLDVCKLSTLVSFNTQTLCMH